VRHLIAAVGKALVTAGLLILLFVGYQLWGTGIYTARAQERLTREFADSIARSGRPPSTTPPGSTTPRPTTSTAVPTTLPVPTTVVTAPPPVVAEGSPLAQLVIGKIGLDVIVIQGTDESDLRNGPGHYPSTPWPGQAGNAAIAGHRTTYGAPFGELDQLEVGDAMVVTTVQGKFEYRVYEKVIVSPSAFQVLDPDPVRKATLTLTTCHPKYSAAQRLVVKAELVIPPGVQPLPSSVDPDDPVVKRARTGDVLSGDSGSKTPTLIAGLICALVGMLWWLLFHRHPRWTTWFTGAIPFVVSLGAFYYLLERVLPANY
jgi:sortase A